MDAPEPVVPDYAGRCTTNIVPQLLAAIEGRTAEAWTPDPLIGASAVVLLVIDGLGWNQLLQRPHVAPFLTSFAGGAVTTAVPTTTPTCLTSIVTGSPPAQHGIVGFHISIDSSQVMNAQQWTIDGEACRHKIDPFEFQRSVPFQGADVASIVRTGFLGGGFTDAQFKHSHVIGYRFTSSIPLRIKQQLDQGHKLVYAYYDGLDVTAHTEGLGELYDAELRYVDKMVEEICAQLPSGAALAVTADHGHVAMTDGYIDLDREIVDRCIHVSGESRFRWLHVDEPKRSEILERCIGLYGDRVWIKTYGQAVEEGWFGGTPDASVRSRYGDIALAPHAPLGILEPFSHTKQLVTRHGSLTADEIYVPFIATRP